MTKEECSVCQGDKATCHQCHEERLKGGSYCAYHYSIWEGYMEDG